MIRLSNIYKSYDNLNILKNFNITFDTNKISCLVGPSGVGKTTVANIAAKLIKLDSGDIIGADETVYSYVFQEPRLLDWYSVYENIDFVLQNVYESRERKETIDKYLDIVELNGYRDFKPPALSGGMAQRVSIARAFAYPSDVLIMDEPFKGLDVKLKNDLMESFQKLWRESKRTVIFITHDIDEAAELSHMIYVLKNTPAELVRTFDMDLYAGTDKDKVKAEITDIIQQ